MEYALEHLGVAVAAVTGVLAARGKRIDLFGILVLALVTAFGGGTTRDLLLGVRVFWVGDPWYLVTATITAVAWFFVAHLRRLAPRALLVADAYALALFTVVGTRKALWVGADPFIAVGMGVVTGVAGGIARDVLLGSIPLVFRPYIHLYATAAAVGAAAFVGLARVAPAMSPYNMLAATLVIVALRLAGIRWRLTLPVLDEEETPPQEP